MGILKFVVFLAGLAALVRLSVMTWRRATGQHLSGPPAGQHPAAERTRLPVWSQALRSGLVLSRRRLLSRPLFSPGLRWRRRRWW